MIDKLLPIFKDIFELEELAISRDTTAADIEEWDSLSHIYLIVAIEKEFSVKFNSAEIQRFKNVGDIIDCIQTKG